MLYDIKIQGQVSFSFNTDKDQFANDVKGT